MNFDIGVSVPANKQPSTNATTLEKVTTMIRKNTTSKYLACVYATDAALTQYIIQPIRLILFTVQKWMHVIRFIDSNNA